MAKIKTKPVRVGKYSITSHAQNRIVDEKRNMNKCDVIDNLFTKPNAISKIKYDNLNRPSYRRIGKRITTRINPNNNYVTTVTPVSRQDIRDFNLINIGKKGGKKKYVRSSKLQSFTKSKTRS